MLSKLFPGARVRAVGKVIDQMIGAALHVQEVTGSSPHRFFMSHPMKTDHRTIDQHSHGTTHVFVLSGPEFDLEIMAHEGVKSFVVAMPQGEYLGASIQASTKGRYTVRLDKPLSQPVGKLARRLLKEFVKVHDAVDATV